MATPLAQHLVARGLLSQERVDEALRRQAIAGGALDTALLERGHISEAGILQALSDVSGMRLVNLADFEPNPEMAGVIPRAIADQLSLAPLSLDGQTLHVACTFPPPVAQLQEVGQLLGKTLEPWVAVECRVRDWLSTLYQVPLGARHQALLYTLDPSRPPPAAPTPKPAAAAGQPAKTAPLPAAPPEEGLSAAMLERLAQSVIDEPLGLDEEPIPLEIRKKKGPESAPPPPAPRTSPPSPAAQAPAAGRGLLDADDGWALTQPSFALKVPASRVGVGKGELPVPPAPAAPTAVGPASAPGAKPTAPLPVAGAPRAELPTWTLADARNALKSASHERDDIISVAIQFARGTFEYVAAFAVVQGSAVGWADSGAEAQPGLIRQLSIPLDAASTFRTVAKSRGSFVGPLPSDGLTAQFLAQLGRQPRAIFLYPVEVKGRLVAILYGDSGQKPVSQRKASELLLFCQELPAAFHELILYRKKGGREPAASARPSAPSPETPTPPKRATSGEFLSPQALLLQPRAAQAGGWSPTTGASSAPGLRAGRAPMPVSEGERPPPDFEPILRRLTGPDAAQRAKAVAELSRTPEASAKALVARFPGPTAWSKLPVVELPDADELGPIPGALARLGRPGAEALAPLLDAPDSDLRYLALLTAGNLVYPELVGGVLRGLFDLEPDISSAARAAATALRKLPRFDSAMRSIRQELTSRDSIRRSLAARALGILHDKDSVEGLIGLTSSDDHLVAQAAADALREITRAAFGTSREGWTAWWAANRGKRRLEWVIAGLKQPGPDERLAAIEELTHVFNDNLGFHADGAPEERAAAVRRWELFAAQAPTRELDR